MFQCCFHQKGLLGALSEDELAKLKHDIGCICASRWMTTIVCAGKAELFDGQIPLSVLSVQERKGVLSFTHTNLVT